MNKIKSIFIITLLIVGITPIFMSNAIVKADIDMSDWDCVSKITIDHTKVNADLVDFPVFLNFTSSDLLSFAQSDGDDICFLDSTNSTQYKHELVTYNSSTGHLNAWVRVTSLSDDTDTIIYMYYGNPLVANQEDVYATWTSNYKLVSHMKQSTDTTIDDSTSNAFSIAKKGIGEPVSSVEDEKLEYSQFYNNDANDYLTTGTTSSFAWMHGKGNQNLFTYTITLWLKMDNPQTDSYEGIISTDAGSSTQVGMYIVYDDSSGSSRERVLIFKINVGSSGQYACNLVSNNSCYPDDNNWHMLTLTYDQSLTTGNAKLYIDGELKEIKTKDASTPKDEDSTSSLHIGSMGDGSLALKNTNISELQISNSVLTTGWLNAYYNNTNNPNTFYTVEIIGETPDVLEPTVTTSDATEINSFHAMLNGYLDNDGGETCNVSFEWGETDEYGNNTDIQSKQTDDSFNITITDLLPSTEYHYRAIATNSNSTSYGVDKEFITLFNDNYTDVILFNLSELGWDSMIPWILKMPNGTLWAIAESQSSNDTKIRKSFDNGETWTIAEDWLCPIGRYYGFVVKDSRIFIASYCFPDPNMDTYISYSDDNGDNWSSPMLIYNGDREDNGYQLGYKAGFVSTSGRIIMAGQSLDVSSTTDYSSSIIYSDLSGINASDWKFANINSSAYTVEKTSECGVLQLRNDTLWAFMRNSNEAPITNGVWGSYSEDDGETWGDSYELNTVLGTEDLQEAPVDAIRFTNDVETDKNRILIAWCNHSTSATRKYLTVAVSYDESQSFPYSRLVEITEQRMENPQFMILPNNIIGLCYIKNNHLEYKFARFSIDWLTSGNDHVIENILNVAPEQAVCVSPDNDEIDVSITTVLEVMVEDSNDDDMTVSFYWENNTFIEDVIDVNSGSNALTSELNLELNTSYSWYVNVSDGELYTLSDVFTFTTEVEIHNESSSLSIDNVTPIFSYDGSNLFMIYEGDTIDSIDLITLMGDSDNLSLMKYNLSIFDFENWSGDVINGDYIQIRNSGDSDSLIDTMIPIIPTIQFKINYNGIKPLTIVVTSNSSGTWEMIYNNTDETSGLKTLTDDNMIEYDMYYYYNISVSETDVDENSPLPIDENYKLRTTSTETIIPPPVIVDYTLIIIGIIAILILLGLALMIIKKR